MSLDGVFRQAAEKFSMTGFIRGLRSEGYDFINHATNTFASCLHKEDEPEVIILNTDSACAPAFYRFCSALSGNPFFPKIHEIYTFGESACAVRMERLIALDHVNIAEEDRALLEQNAPLFVSYLLGEACGFEESADLKDAAVKILQLSQDVYKGTDGRILPYCDIKPDNVFLRKTPKGPQFVFGDPLFPGSGGNAENRESMNAIYQKFGLPVLEKIEATPANAVPSYHHPVLP